MLNQSQQVFGLQPHLGENSYFQVCAKLNLEKKGRGEA